MHVDTGVCIFMCRVCTYGGGWQGLSSEAEKEKPPHKASAGVFLVEMLDPACVLSRQVRGQIRESRKKEREEAAGRRGCRERGAGRAETQSSGPVLLVPGLRGESKSRQKSQCSSCEGAWSRGASADRTHSGHSPCCWILLG